MPSCRCAYAFKYQVSQYLLVCAHVDVSSRFTLSFMLTCVHVDVPFRVMPALWHAFALMVVRCGAVRCGAVRCGAVRCGAVRTVVERSLFCLWHMQDSRHLYLVMDFCAGGDLNSLVR